MANQIRLFPEEPKLENKAKRNWENAFQRWSNDKALNSPTEHYGKCGYGSMCDYCGDFDKGRPCVRALNAMCRDKRISINYNERDFEEIWDTGRSDSNA